MAMGMFGEQLFEELFGQKEFLGPR